MPPPISSGSRHRPIRAFAAALIFFFATGLEVSAASIWRPLSDTRTNNGVWMASATVGWAVGDEGLICQTTNGGTTWTPQTSGVVVNLNAVWGVDTSNVWAVGDAGTILKYNGTAWAAQTSPVTQNLNAIHGVSASAIWAVGQSSTIVKFNGTSWATQTAPNGQKYTLQGVWAADATNAWAVGLSGKILKIGATSYQTSGTSKDLFAVWGTSATNILVVGQSGTVQLSSNGTSWVAGPTSGVSTILRGISGTDASNVWIVGDGGVVEYYNGSGNFTAQSSNSTQALNAVSAFSTTSVMAVGAGKTFDHFGGAAWSAQASPVPSSNFAGVWASDDNNVWFAGPGGAMMLWNGATFTLPLTGVAVALNDVWGADPNNVWAVGAGGTIIKWNGAAWSTQVSGTIQVLNSVSGTSATDVWAVGASGTILHFNGTSWSTKTSGTTQPLNGVWAASATAAWAVGNAGVILKWSGSTWAAQTSGTTQSLNEVQGASATAVWAVGAAGTILKYSGSTWAVQASGTGTALSALAVVNSTTLWAAGGTTILKGTGTTWAADGVTGLPNGVLAAWATGANTVFLSTQGGLIFTNSPAAVPEIGVEQPAGTKLNNNQSTVSFGTVTTPGTSTLTFTVTSSGNADITGLAITKDGTNAAEFTVSTLATTTLATGTTTTFDVTFTPATEGTRTANLHIASNDLDEPAFNIALTGVGQLPVTITTQPLSKTVNPNIAVTFSVAATGTKALSYQWQKFNTMTTLFEPITGATGTSYAIAKALESDQGDYRVVVTNPAGSVDSNTATLSVNDPVAIVAPLIASQTVATGATVTFTVNATGTETKKYQWRKNGINLVNSTAIAGATSATLTLTNTQLIHAGVYSVLVSNMVNSQLSANATLTVIDATAKTLKLPTLGKATIVASYTGTPTSFLWQKDGGALPVDFRYTYVKNVLTITSLQVAPFTDAGVYTCAITGPGGGPVTSTTTLIVYSFAPDITGTAPLSMPDAMVGDPSYTYQIPFDSDPLKTPTSFIASGLPAGLKCNALTGLITGKPAVAISADKTYVVTLTAANAKNKSVKTANLLLKALPAASVGVFTGPIVRSNTQLNKNLGGRFDLTTTSTGSFTGKVMLGALAYSFSGALVSDVTGVNAPAGVVLIKRTLLLPNLNITFTMDLANHALTSCDVNDGTNHASFSAWRKRWGTVMPLADLTDLKTYLGYYTFGLDPAVPATVSPITPAEVQPQGMGYGSFTVASTGLLTAAGKLPDNTAWSCATFCGPHGEVLVYQPLYSSLGSIVGSLDITQGTVGYVPSYGDNTLGGTLTWLRPTTATHVYKTGFGPINVTALGGRYVAPVAPALLFGVTDDNMTNNAHVVFTDGGISGTSTDSTGTQISPDVNVRIKAGGLVFVPAHSTLIMPDPNPRSTTLAITQSSGYFTGKAAQVDPNPAVSGTNITRTPYYYGLIIRDGSVMRGYGFFLLPRRPDLATQTVLTTDQLSGQVVLEKSP